MKKAVALWGLTAGGLGVRWETTYLKLGVIEADPIVSFDGAPTRAYSEKPCGPNWT